MYNAKDCPLSANCSFTHNVASLLASTFRSSHHVQIKLGARCLLKQTSAFAYLLQEISLWVCSPVSLDPSDQVPAGLGPLVRMGSPSPFFTRSSMFALANIGFHSNAGIPCAIARVISITNAWYKGKVQFQQSNKYAFLRANGATFLHLGASLWVPPLGEKGQPSHNIGKWSRTPSLKRANGAINMHSRRPTEQHFLRFGASLWVPP